jgi:hypothetical protein
MPVWIAQLIGTYCKPSQILEKIQMLPRIGQDSNPKLDEVEMRALSEPARVAAERQKRIRFFEEKMLPRIGQDSNSKLDAVEMRALSEPARVAAERQQRIRFFEEKMVPETGFEPVTRGFSIRCSTN